MRRITVNLPTPYMGLRAFTEKEALLFFGRDTHVRDLLAKLEGKQRFISVLGASGTGKSSLVRAGLIPALHRGALAAAGYRWNVHILKPGNAPLANLAHALTEDERWIENDDRLTSISSLSSLLRASPLALVELYRQKSDRFADEALLLVVDQFEEIFRYRQKDTDEAEAFIALLLRSASENFPIYVVITMRSDFLGNCVAFLNLPDAINSGIYLTPRLGVDQLKSIIASPLALVGGEIDPVMVNRLVNTLGGEDELPVLEHAMLCMWYYAKEDERNRIEQSDFNTVCAPRGLHDLGGITPGPMLSFAIDNHASEIYEALAPEQRSVARQLFLALVERREGRDERRPQELHQLIEQIGERERENIISVIEAFRAEGVGFLLPPATEEINDGTLIDISHESLFRQWRMFQQWLKEEELDVTELKEWQQRATRQKEGGGWLDENDCERAQRWHARISGRVDPRLWAGRYTSEDAYQLLDGYITASIQRLQHIKLENERQELEIREAEARRLELEAKLQRETAERAMAEKLHAEEGKRKAEAFAASSRRKTYVATTGFGLAMLFFLVAVAVAWWTYSLSKEALAREYVAIAEKLAKSNPDQSVLIALAGHHISKTRGANAFIRFAKAHYSYSTILRGHQAGVRVTQFSPDGKTVVTASLDNTARLWRCDICRPVDEIAAELEKAIGRGLTAEEQRRFGVNDTDFLSSLLLFSR